MDRLTAERRSWNMSRIRSTDTRPEVIVRSMLHRCGYRFRIHRADLPGKPDIVLPRYHAAVLVHGCYWHRHPGCKYAYSPKTRRSFWDAKFAANVARDAEVDVRLREMGWLPIVVWECELRNLDRLEARLVGLLDKDAGSLALETSNDLNK